MYKLPSIKSARSFMYRDYKVVIDILYLHTRILYLRQLYTIISTCIYIVECIAYNKIIKIKSLENHIALKESTSSLK